MSSLLTVTPLDPEPLPLYSRRDPDTLSIHSAAPSYVSDTPTYSSQPACPPQPAPVSLLPPPSPSQNQQPRGLPAVRYAPGFRSRDPAARARGLMVDPNGWMNTRTSNNSKQYSAVANRRANHIPPRSTPASSATTTATTTPPACSPTQPTAYPVTVGSSTSSVGPLEDPYLVGEEAAGRARAQRVYREMCLRGEDTMRYESRSWDFMRGQMADWDERQRNWASFRQRVGQTRRKLGWMGCR